MESCRPAKVERRADRNTTSALSLYHPEHRRDPTRKAGRSVERCCSDS